MGRAESFTLDAKSQPCEEDNRHLREAVSALRAAVRTERGRREGVEKECNLLIAEFSRLQTRVQVEKRNDCFFFFLYQAALLHKLAQLARNVNVSDEKKTKERSAFFFFFFCQS